MIGCSWGISPPQGKVEKWLTAPQNLIGTREEQLPKGRGNIPSKRGEKMLGRVKTIDVLYDLYDLLRINLGGISWYPLRPQFSSAQFSHSVMSDSLQPHGLQHASAFPILHQPPKLIQTCVHQVGDAIQPSHLLSSPSPPAFNLSQHQALFQWVSSLHQAAKVLEFQLQHQSFQWIFRTDFLQDWLDGSPCSPRDSQESSPTPQFKSINSLVLSFLYSPALTFIHDYWKNHSFD